jgi:hypothetical protein
MYMPSVVDPLNPETLNLLLQTNRTLVQEPLQIGANSKVGGIQVVLGFQNLRNLKME